MRIVATTPSTDYAELKRIIKAGGYLEAQTGYYIVKTIIAIATLGLAFALAIRADAWWTMVLCGLFAGFASTQVALLAHDVGHRQGFRGRRANAIGRVFFGNFVLGVSHSWWNTKHNQHHATPNHIDKDPDVQFPMLAFSLEQVATRPRFWRPVIGIQAFVLLFLLPFQAMNMRLSSALHLREGTARQPLLQAAVLACHVIVYVAVLVAVGWPHAIVFALVHQATFGLYNSSVFASNHKGMPLVGDGERMDFLREQVLTSRNVKAHAFTDFWYGGLNYQIEHHLFPTMPRNRLRAAQPIIEQFCRERGISYHSTGLFESYKEVLGHLHEMGAEIRGGTAPSVAS
ncbi:MAG: fatty acid desaturase family protein [Tepidiformaceae bacterium]